MEHPYNIVLRLGFGYRLGTGIVYTGGIKIVYSGEYSCIPLEYIDTINRLYKTGQQQSSKVQFDTVTFNTTSNIWSCDKAYTWIGNKWQPARARLVVRLGSEGNK